MGGLRTEAASRAQSPKGTERDAVGLSNLHEVGEHRVAMEGSQKASPQGSPAVSSHRLGSCPSAGAGTGVNPGDQ